MLSRSYVQAHDEAERLNNYLELLGDDMIVSSEQERTEYLGIAYHKNLDLQRLIHNLFEVLDNLIYNGLRHTPEGGEKDGSSGLGLYIVKTTAEAMGGSVRVESTLGKGTVFTVTFSAG